MFSARLFAFDFFSKINMIIMTKAMRFTKHILRKWKKESDFFLINESKIPSGWVGAVRQQAFCYGHWLCYREQAQFRPIHASGD